MRLHATKINADLRLDQSHISVSCIVGVYLSLRGVIYNNNSIICITEIGEAESATNNALQCITDRMPCCQTPPNGYGEWYLPNGELVGLTKNHSDPFNTFYRTRGDDGAVNLNHVGSTLNRTNSPLGLFCCQVPDSTNVIQQICAYISELLC